MNLVGKILVFLIFVMSIVFMGFAVAVYSTHKNWIEAAQKTNKQLLASQNETREAEEKFKDLQDQVAAEKKDRELRIAQLEEKSKLLDDEKKTLETQLAGLKDESAKQLAALTTAQTSLNKGLEQIDTLRKEIGDVIVQRDDNFQKLVSLQDQFNMASGELTRATATNERLATQMGTAKQLLDRQGMNLETPVDGTPPKVDGVVLASGANGLIEISLGSDDGLQRGNQLDVYRDNKYKAKIEVLQTAPDKSVAKVIPGFQKAKIQRDDRVATRLF
jgi:chromosome segregation ATPase